MGSFASITACPEEERRVARCGVGLEATGQVQTGVPSPQLGVEPDAVTAETGLADARTNLACKD